MLCRFAYTIIFRPMSVVQKSQTPSLFNQHDALLFWFPLCIQRRVVHRHRFNYFLSFFFPTIFGPFLNVSLSLNSLVSHGFKRVQNQRFSSKYVGQDSWSHSNVFIIAFRVFSSIKMFSPQFFTSQAQDTQPTSVFLKFCPLSVTELAWVVGVSFSVSFHIPFRHPFLHISFSAFLFCSYVKRLIKWLGFNFHEPLT